MSESSSTVWFITGANRGIGLELTKQLLETPTNVVLATCRDPSKADALKALGASAGDRLHILRLDVTDTPSIQDAAREAAKILGDNGIDYLINYAGVGPGGFDTGYAFKEADFTSTFHTNVIGPAVVAATLLPLVERGARKTLLSLSSTVGSIGSIGAVHHFNSVCATYAASKAALNMLVAKQAAARPDIISIAICPGYLQTDLGGPTAATPASVGVAGVLKVVAGLTPADSGAFFNNAGERVPW